MINPSFIGFEQTPSRPRNHTRFHWSPPVGKPRISPLSFPVAFVMSKESYEVCRLVHHQASDFTGKKLNGPNYRFGPDCGPCIAAIAGSCNDLTQRLTYCL